MDLTKLYCEVDDYINSIQNKNSYLLVSRRKRCKSNTPRLSLSEMITIVVWYHSSGFKNFKSFYLYLLSNHKRDFPRLISYTRFIDWMPYLLLPMSGYLKSKMAKCTGISFVDSTPLKVCENIRIPRNKVFEGIAERSKSSMGWFFGFKLHLVINHCGEILSFSVTKGNTNDRVPVKKLCSRLTGKLYGDKGYLSKKLFDQLYGQGLELVTNVRSNMKNKLLTLEDKIRLRQRFIIETVNDLLKNVADLEHSRHRSPVNFMVNIIAALISYTLRAQKPQIRGINLAKLAPTLA